MARLSLALLGPFHVALDGVDVAASLPLKARALLSYLASDLARPQLRETLAGLLWPGYAERSARANLSQCLWLLRRALGENDSTPQAEACLIATRISVQLTPENCDCDLAAFAALMAACRTHSHKSAADCAPCASRLENALALYTGDFAAGLTLSDSPEFEEWLLLQREQLRRQAVEAARTLTRRAQGASKHQEAVVQAQHWVTLDPMDEEGQRALMRSLALGGQRSAALAQYETCRRLLQQELDVTPDAETLALYASIQKGTLGGGAPQVEELAARAPAFLAEAERYRLSLFVARQRELAQLSAHLQSAMAGEPLVVFVTGEAGRGKSALLQAFCQQAMQTNPDLVAVTGHCDAAVGVGDPCLPFREILAQLTGDVQARWQAGAMGSVQASRLWSLLPEAGLALAEEAPDLVGSFVAADPLSERAVLAAPEEAQWASSLQRVVERSRAPAYVRDIQQPALFAQYAAVLQRLARHHPLLLVLEDLQWADTGTAGLLFHLGTRLQGAPVLLLGAYRPSEVSAAAPLAEHEGRHPLLQAVNEFQRRYGEIVVDLDRADGQHFVEALLDMEANELGAGFRAALLRQSGGNALFTVELLRSMRERGELQRDGAGRWVENATDWSAMPARVEGVIAQRIARLSPLLQRALRVAAVEGETFTAEAVARILDLEAGGLIQQLSEQVGRRHQLITAIETQRVGERSISRYRFRHILVQAHLYGALDPVERAYLHREVGRALEELHAGALDEIAAHLARHFELASATEKAIAHLQRAGERALLLSAYHEAAGHFRHALVLLAQLSHTRERDQLELALEGRLGFALQPTLGMYATECGASYERACALARQLGDIAGLFSSLRMLNTYYSTIAEFGAALACADEMMAIAREQKHDAMIAAAGAFAGWVRIWLGELPQALADQKGVVERCARGQLPTTPPRPLYYAGSMGFHALALLLSGYAQQAQRYLDLGEQVAYTLGARDSICLTYGYRAMWLLYAGNPQAGLAAAETQAQMAEEQGYPMFAMLARLYTGWAHALLGEPEVGIGDLEEAIAECARYGARSFLPGMYFALGEALGRAGRPTEGLRAIERGFELQNETGERLHRAELHRVRGDLLLQLDEPDVAGAEAAYHAALDTAYRQSARLLELRTSVRLGRLWQRQGRSEEARALVQAIYDWFTEGFDMPDLVAAREFLAPEAIEPAVG